MIDLAYFTDLEAFRGQGNCTKRFGDKDMSYFKKKKECVSSSKYIVINVSRGNKI